MVAQALNTLVDIVSCACLNAVRAGVGQSRKKLTQMGILLLIVSLLFPVCCFSQVTSEAPSGGEPKTAVEGEQAKKGEATEKKAPVEHTFQEMVVTATRTPVPLWEVPAAVSVVTKEDIDKRNIQAVDTALDLVPGLFDKHSKPLDTTASVILRGIPDQKRNLVLLDGQPLNDGYTGVVNWNGMLPENIDRIEVARGPFSSLYGGNAMGGVINILTKMPEKREVTLQGGSGSDGYYNVYGSYGDKLFNRLSVFGSFGYQASNGYPTNLVVKTPTTPGTGTRVIGAEATTTPQGAPAFLIGNAGDNNWNRDSGILKLAYDLTDNSKATFSFNRNQYWYGYQNPNNFLTNSSGNPFWSGNAIFNNNRFSVSESNFLPGEGGVTQNVYNLGYETGLFSNTLLRVNCGYIDNTSNWYSTPGSTALRTGLGAGTVNQTPSQAFTSDLNLTFPIFERNTLIFGGSFRYDHANTQSFNLISWQDTNSLNGLTYTSGGKDNIYSIYGQDEIAILENLKAYIGLRGDWWDTYDGMVNQTGTAGATVDFPSRSAFNPSPKGSLVYTPFEKTLLRGSVGTSFRPPNVYELYRTWSLSGTTYASNPFLDPETSFSWDVGVEQRIWEGAVVKASYFSNRLHDLIYLQTITSTLRMYQNATTAETNGVEFEWDHRLAKWFRYFTNFTYTHSEILDNPLNPLSVGKQIIGVPTYMFNVGGEVTYGGASAVLTGRYVSKVYGNDQNTDVVNGVYGTYDPYFVLDLSLKYAITKNAIISFAIDNICNTNYFQYYQAPGRKFFGSLAFKF